MSHALHQALPWLGDDDRVGIHLIHGAESGNGWMRPEDPDNEVLLLSRRTKMTLRLPKDRLDEARQLTGVTLDIDGYPLEVSDSSVRKLSTSAILFARYVIANENESEQDFTASVIGKIEEMVYRYTSYCVDAHMFWIFQGERCLHAV